MRDDGAGSDRLRAGLASVLALFWMCAAPGGCGQKGDPSPFDGVPDAGAGGASTDAGLTPPEAGVDPVLGGPCLDDGQCDDDIECTRDACDSSVGRCRFSPVHEACADDVFCDGVELCQPGLGCREGEAVACSDSTTCTIDVCVEATQSCEHAPRDADGDGDAVWNCGSGNDCDDSDPLINGNAVEVCENARDDDCDLEVDGDDRGGCVYPAHDTCLDPLLVDTSGSYALSFAAATPDAPFSCMPADVASQRDVVVQLNVPEGEPTDVDIVVRAHGAPFREKRDGSVALGAAESCLDATSKLACAAGAEHPEGGGVARLALRELAPGAYPIYVWATTDIDATLDVRYGPLPAPPLNETCSTAALLVPGQQQQVSLATAKDAVESACTDGAGDVVFRFELAEAGDVELRAVSLDGYGVPALSLRREPCTELTSELSCRAFSPARLFARALPRGTYYAIVSSSGPTDVDVALDVFPPTEAPPDEGCSDPPELPFGESLDVDLARRVDAVASACRISASDATYALRVEEKSDLLVVERISAGDRGAVSLFAGSCRPERNLVCSGGQSSPVRARALGVEPGEYRVVAESDLGAPITLTALRRPARAATLVAVADGCEDAVSIPAAGGRFIGNTSNAEPDFTASCDIGTSSSGAPEQMLRLKLGERRRVVFDMGLSDYDTMLVVRRADGCPGTEVARACAPGDNEGKSYLDLTLSAGDYFVQVDGFAGDSGPWVLDVFTAEP